MELVHAVRVVLEVLAYFVLGSGLGHHTASRQAYLKPKFLQSTQLEFTRVLRVDLAEELLYAALMLFEFLAEQVLLLDEVFGKDVLVQRLFRHALRRHMEGPSRARSSAFALSQLVLDELDVDTDEVDKAERVRCLSQGEAPLEVGEESV